MTFEEFINGYHRMCESYYDDGDCGACPYRVHNNDDICEVSVIANYEVAEDVVEEWVAENSKAVYPTFAQWQKEAFPKSKKPMTLCSFTETKCEPFDMYKCMRCYEYVDMPKEVAEILGVEPDVKWRRHE